MNYEQRYKEALKAVKELQEANPSDDGIQNWVEEKFPELKESGDYDERVRKALIDGFKRYDYGALFNGCFVREILPWLEKQAKKSSKWSEEDEKMVNDIIAAIDTLYYHGMVNWLKGIYCHEMVNWLKGIKSRI